MLRLFVINMLKSDQIKQLEEKLYSEKSEILKQLKKLEGTSNFGNDVDEDEETDETEELANTLGVKKTLEERLDKVENALKKITGNNYGKCEKCGKNIDLELLKIDPESELCRNCKKL